MLKDESSRIINADYEKIMNKQTNIMMNNYRITVAKIFYDSLILWFIQPSIHPTVRSLVHSFVCSFFHSFIRSFFHSLIRSFFHSFFRSSVHSLTRSFVHSFIRSFVHSFNRSFVHSFIRSFVHSFIRSFVYSFIRSFVHSFIHSFVYSFIRSFIHLLEANTKNSNLIVFSGNGQNKNKVNFKSREWNFTNWWETNIVGIEKTSSVCYTYARGILSKKAIKVFSSFPIIATTNIEDKLFNARAKPLLIYALNIWGPELLSYKTHFDRRTIEQFHIKFLFLIIIKRCIVYSKYCLQSRPWVVSFKRRHKSINLQLRTGKDWKHSSTEQRFVTWSILRCKKIYSTF